LLRRQFLHSISTSKPMNYKGPRGNSAYERGEGGSERKKIRPRGSIRKGGARDGLLSWGKIYIWAGISEGAFTLKRGE